jgi:hypothetical protein
MAALWEPDESDSSPYDDVHRHSEGMVSFTYQRPSEEILEELKNTETFRRLRESKRKLAEQL